jgi:hypothetical protein
MTTKRKTADDLRREGVRLAIRVASTERDRLFYAILRGGHPTDERIALIAAYRAVCAMILLLARTLDAGGKL